MCCFCLRFCVALSVRAAVHVGIIRKRDKSGALCDIKLALIPFQKMSSFYSGNTQTNCFLFVAATELHSSADCIPDPWLFFLYPNKPTL